MAAAVALCGVASVTSASAQDTKTVRVRGTIESVDPSALKVKTREGKDVTVQMADDVHVSGIRKASMSDIHTGDFVGVASVPNDNGGNGAVEVLIFPKAMAGTGEGSYPWDLQPNSTMTNATVTNAVTDVGNGKLTLKYKDGEKTVALPDGIPVVTLAEATKKDLKAGFPVFVPAQDAGDGKVSTKFIVVGDAGVAPPM